MKKGIIAIAAGAALALTAGGTADAASYHTCKPKTPTERSIAKLVVVKRGNCKLAFAAAFLGETHRQRGFFRARGILFDATVMGGFDFLDFHSNGRVVVVGYARP